MVNINCLRSLIIAGAAVNSCDSGGNTALIYATKGDHRSCVNVLLDSGADVNHVNMNGETALVCAATMGS